MATGPAPILVHGTTVPPGSPPPVAGATTDGKPTSSQELFRQGDVFITRETVTATDPNSQLQFADKLVINTGAGDDRINGGDGRDDLFGNTGNDRIDGGRGNDVIHGGDGDDRLLGGDGRDYLEGGRGNDRLEGGRGNDILSGGLGDDRLSGDRGNDVVYAGAGADRIDNRSGVDTVYAQGGEDTITNARGARNQVTEVDMSATVGSTITVNGSSAFQQRTEADLEMLRASPNGRQMLSELDRGADPALGNGKRLTIEELQSEYNGFTGPVTPPTYLQTDAAGVTTPGSGEDTRIQYNPSDHTEPFPVPAVTLYHELSHAYNGVNGTAQQGTFGGVGGPGGADAGMNNDERQAVGLDNDGVGFDFDRNPATPDTTANPKALTENGLREEMGLPLRPSYDIGTWDGGMAANTAPAPGAGGTTALASHQARIDALLAAAGSGDPAALRAATQGVAASPLGQSFREQAAQTVDAQQQAARMPPPEAQPEQAAAVGMGRGDEASGSSSEQADARARRAGRRDPGRRRDQRMRAGQTQGQAGEPPHECQCHPGRARRRRGERRDPVAGRAPAGRVRIRRRLAHPRRALSRAQRQRERGAGGVRPRQRPGRRRRPADPRRGRRAVRKSHRRGHRTEPRGVPAEPADPDRAAVAARDPDRAGPGARRPFRGRAQGHDRAQAPALVPRRRAVRQRLPARAARQRAGPAVDRLVRGGRAARPAVHALVRHRQRPLRGLSFLEARAY